MVYRGALDRGGGYSGMMVNRVLALNQRATREKLIMTEKYRVALSIPAWELIHTLLSASDNPLVPEIILPIKKLIVLNSAGLKNADVKIKHNKTMMDKLGLGVEQNMQPPAEQPMTPLEKRKSVYYKWLADNNSCTPEELGLVQTYRMDNKLMSAEEEKEYIDSQMAGFFKFKD